MVKISAFIIAKNEETGIGEALKSLVSFCDEIIVVDTGSTDKTKEKAFEYTDKVFDFEWIDDFAAARNFALSKCTGDWIVWMDADDEIPINMQVKIRNLINSAPLSVAGFFVTYRYSAQKDQLLPRIFRNGTGLEFIMPVHEYLDIPESLLAGFKTETEIEIVHRKEGVENKNTMERNISILKKAITAGESKSGIENDEIEHLGFFLGRDLLNAKDFQAAEAVFSGLAAAGSVSDKSFRYNIRLHLGRALAGQKKYIEALKAFELAVTEDTRFNEPLIESADIYLYSLGKPDKAKVLYERSLTITKPVSTFGINPSNYHAYPAKQLGKIAELKKPAMLICGYYGMQNIGDELMLAALIQKYRPAYRIIAASYNPVSTRKIHNVESVAHRHEHFNLALQQCQIVIIGGGTLFHDQGMKDNTNVEYYCSIIDTARREGKKIHLEGVGVDKIHLRENRELIKKSIPYCEKIEVRDSQSRDNLVECGIEESSIVVGRDLVFDLKISEFKLGDGKGKIKKRVGINLCPPLKDNPSKLMVPVEEKLLPFLEENRDKYEFVFIPGSPEDLKYIDYFRVKIGLELNVFQPDAVNFIGGYLKIISSCDYLIASRYHMILLGRILNVPTTAISYSEKTDRLTALQQSL